MPVKEERETGLYSFLNFLNSTGSYYLWTYSSNLELIQTTCPSIAFDKVFKNSGCKDYLLKKIKEDNKPSPVILYSSLGFLWCADYIKDVITGDIEAVYLIGPVKTDAIKTKDRKPFGELQIPKEWMSGLGRLSVTLPTMSLDSSIVSYAQMFHYAISGEKITAADVTFQKESQESMKGKQHDRKDRHLVYMIELAVINNIRKGNLDFKADFDKMVQRGAGVKMVDSDSLTRGKVSIITFIGTCTRAAIEGGLTPDAAFYIGDQYLQKIMECNTIAGLRDLNYEMYETFIKEVNKIRKGPVYSVPVQSCCDYIKANLKLELTAALLSEHVGYSEYYITRRFKAETGFSVSDYIKEQRVVKAKEYLLFTSLSIKEIASKLNFCSSSYFTRVFHTVSGVTPAVFRAKNQKL